MQFERNEWLLTPPCTPQVTKEEVVRLLTTCSREKNNSLSPGSQKVDEPWGKYNSYFRSELKCYHNYFFKAICTSCFRVEHHTHFVPDTSCPEQVINSNSAILLTKEYCKRLDTSSSHLIFWSPTSFSKLFPDAALLGWSTYFLNPLGRHSWEQVSSRAKAEAEYLPLMRCKQGLCSRSGILISHFVITGFFNEIGDISKSLPLNKRHILTLILQLDFYYRLLSMMH